MRRRRTPSGADGSAGPEPAAGHRARSAQDLAPAAGSAETATEHQVVCHLDRLLADRGMTLTELAQRAGVTVVNLSVLKNDRARAIRFSTLTAVCEVLECQPGDLLTVTPAQD